MASALSLRAARLSARARLFDNGSLSLARCISIGLGDGGADPSRDEVRLAKSSVRLDVAQEVDLAALEFGMQHSATYGTWMNPLQ